MFTIRKAAVNDLDFLIAADMASDGWTPTTDEERTAHRLKISAFVREANASAWIAVDDQTGARAGTIMVLYHDRYHEPATEANQFLFRFLDDAIFPADGRFCEVYQLWVEPAYRRQGLGTLLKQQIEAESRQRGMSMIYTHTEAKNEHVIELNRKLGYQFVRCGPIWDDVPRTSLVKWLT